MTTKPARKTLSLFNARKQEDVFDEGHLKNANRGTSGTTGAKNKKQDAG